MLISRPEIAVRVDQLEPLLRNEVVDSSSGSPLPNAMASPMVWRGLGGTSWLLVTTTLIVAVTLATSITARAQEAVTAKTPSKTPDKTTAKIPADAKAETTGDPKTLREFIDASMAWYEVFPSMEATDPAKVMPVLRWANNARGSEDGMTMLYVHEGLPLAVACAYPWEKRLEHAFESLSRNKIVGRREGVIVWQPREPSVKFADIPGAPVPEATRAGRLRQLKVLSERFQATMLGWKADATDREELRLLPRPLYRYEPKAGDIVDGAVFAFVMGTDPEVLLQLEVVKAGEKTTWQYAFTRRTSGKLEGRLDQSVVWSAEHFPVQNDPRRPHFCIGRPLPPDIAAEQAKLQETKK